MSNEQIVGEFLEEMEKQLDATIHGKFIPLKNIPLTLRLPKSSIDTRTRLLVYCEENNIGHKFISGVMNDCIPCHLVWRRS